MFSKRPKVAKEVSDHKTVLIPINTMREVIESNMKSSGVPSKNELRMYQFGDTTRFLLSFGDTAVITYSPVEIISGKLITKYYQDILVAVTFNDFQKEYIIKPNERIELTVAGENTIIEQRKLKYYRKPKKGYSQ